MDIAEGPGPDYEQARVAHVGFVDPYAIEGVLVLRSDDGREFQMRAFSGETARHIREYASGRGGAHQLPTVYRLVEEICEHHGAALVRVNLYDSGEVTRANLYLRGRKDLVLRHYRASDAVALAALYGAPILVRTSLLRPPLSA